MPCTVPDPTGLPARWAPAMRMPTALLALANLQHAEPRRRPAIFPRACFPSRPAATVMALCSDPVAPPMRQPANATLPLPAA